MADNTTNAPNNAAAAVNSSTNTTTNENQNDNNSDVEMNNADDNNTAKTPTATTSITDHASKRIRLYPAGHKEPFYVYIRATKDHALRHISISKHLFTKFPRGTVKRITQMNNFKLRVELSTAAAANDLVKCSDSIFEPYRVYISAEQVEVEGVVQLSTEEPETDLLAYGRGQFKEAAVPEIEVIDVYRDLCV